MPELPDIEAYLAALGERVLGSELLEATVTGPNLLRTVEPRLDGLVGQRVVGLRRVGKRVVLAFPEARFVSIHLMIAGRLHWRPAGAKPPGRSALAALRFEPGTLTLTEAGTRKRSALHVLAGEEALAALDAGGLEVAGRDLDAFREAITRESHTLKRTLTDPRILSGIGNAYSDEILFAARLSPMQLVSRLDDTEVARLHSATRRTLAEWTERLERQRDGGFPEKATAFREGMAVHGRYGKPCPECGAPVQRIRYAANECNYCAACQNEGRLLADRALSRLLKKDWPRTLEELEQRLPARASSRGA